MPHRGLISGAITFQHGLDHIDTPARTIALVAEQHIGWTGGEAKAAMYAGSQHPFRLGDLRLDQLRDVELSLHAAPRRHTPAYIRPGLSTQVGSKLSLRRAESSAMAGASG